MSGHRDQEERLQLALGVLKANPPNPAAREPSNMLYLQTPLWDRETLVTSLPKLAYFHQCLFSPAEEDTIIE